METTKLKKRSNGIVISPFDGLKVSLPNKKETFKIINARKNELKEIILKIENSIKSCMDYEDLADLKSKLTVTRSTYNKTLIILHG